MIFGAPEFFRYRATIIVIVIIIEAIGPYTQGTRADSSHVTVENGQGHVGPSQVCRQETRFILVISLRLPSMSSLDSWSYQPYYLIWFIRPMISMNEMTSPVNDMTWMALKASYSISTLFLNLASSNNEFIFYYTTYLDLSISGPLYRISVALPILRAIP
jgi:hypothetical protein